MVRYPVVVELELPVYDELKHLADLRGVKPGVFAAQLVRTYLSPPAPPRRPRALRLLSTRPVAEVRDA